MNKQQEQPKWLDYSQDEVRACIRNNTKGFYTIKNGHRIYSMALIPAGYGCYYREEDIPEMKGRGEGIRPADARQAILSLGYRLLSERYISGILHFKFSR